MLDDVTDHQLPHLHIYPIMLTSPSRRHNPLSVNGKNFSKYGKVTKTLGSGSKQPPPHPWPTFYHVEGMSGCTYIGTAQVHIALLKFYM